MNQPLFKIVLLTVLVLMTACGMEPSGSEKKAAAKPANETPSDKKEEVKTEESTTPESADALRSGVAKLPAEFDTINTDDVSACHAKGKVFNRRTLRCSKTIFLATAFACTEEGIADGFIYTGYQIDSVLSTAKSDGFVIDQCGESDEGLRLVFFVRADNDGTFSVREIETSIK